MIARLGEKFIQSHVNDKKAIVVLGARQVGKTTLLKKFFKGDDCLWLTGDDLSTQQILGSINLERWKALIGDKKFLIVDEAQRISDIGVKVKLVIDHLPVKVILSGSSSLELANSINEPLTGRKWELKLFPFSYQELQNDKGLLYGIQTLPQRLIYGNYPDIVCNQGKEQELLASLSDSYLYKDLLAWQNIRKPEKLKHLIQALAYQLGNEVSYNELAKTVGMDNQSIEHYIDLLEKNFIVFRLQPLSRNLRKELKTKRKIYFWDNGIRNAVIAQFQPLELRNDRGALFENWWISERLKFLNYNRLYRNTYFWRTQDQQEIDFVEEYNGKFDAFELKWNANKKVRFSKTFTNAYNTGNLELINSENFYATLLAD